MWGRIRYIIAENEQEAFEKLKKHEQKFMLSDNLEMSDVKYLEVITKDVIM